MKYFAKVCGGIDVAPALAQIEAHPELWGADPDRTALPNSPHAQAPDIWLRCRPRREIDHTGRFGEPHFSEFYPAWHTLTALHPIVFDLMHANKAAMLGFSMLSKISPGSEVRPHVDSGWHTNQYPLKAYVILQANHGCINRCGDEEVVMEAGSCWLFENRILHAVVNRGATDRIALIMTMSTR